MTKDRGQDGTGQDMPNLRAVPDDKFDPWEFRSEDTGYERTKFYTKSRDKDGGQSVQNQVTRSVLRDIDELVAEKVIPEYRTRGDFIRDAVYHRLKDISEMRDLGRLHRRVTAEMVSVRRMQRLDELQQLQSSFQATSEVLEQAAHAGHWDLVSEVISDIWDDIEFIPEPFKAKTEHMVRDYATKVKQNRK